MWISLKLFLEDVFKRNLTEFLGRRHIVIDCLKCLFPRPPKRAIANLDALRAAKTNPANFVLHEITDSCARFGNRSNGSGYPFEKKIVIPSNDSGLSVREKLPSVPTARAIRSRKIAILSKGSGYPLEKLSSAVRTARAIRWKKFSSDRTASYCSKPLSSEPFATNLSKNVSLNDLRNSSKLCLPSPHDHEFSRYIFCWIAFCAFITSIIVTSFIQE